MRLMNKLIVASAGSGKTRLVIDGALDSVRLGRRVLITTFTEACANEIYERIIDRNGSFPNNLHLITWFSFLIRHGVKPFQGQLFDFEIKGLMLVNGQSAAFSSESEIKKHYFTANYHVYSDKLAKLTIKCDEASNGMVFRRIERCFDSIYIDEVQDLAGYDLEILDRLFQCQSDITMVGDPRQATYSTNNARKNNKYKKANILNFFADNELKIEADDKSLQVNFRCIQEICDLANSLYPGLAQAKSGNNVRSEHDGVFLICQEDVATYLQNFNPMQLRDSKRTAVNENWDAINFGKSKGMTLERVLIYPSGPILKWLIDSKYDLGQAARSKLYVALTRAKQSVAIVVKKADLAKIKGITQYVLHGEVRS